MKTKNACIARALLVATAFAAAPCPGALTIVDGGFETGTNIVNRHNNSAGASDAGRWAISDSSVRSTTNGNPDGYLAGWSGTSVNGRGLVYIINDNSATAGQWVLSFDWQSLTNDTSANTIQVGVFGIDEGESGTGAFATNSTAAGGGFQVNGGTIDLIRPPGAVGLFTGAVDFITVLSTANAVAWTNFSAVFDLGTNGYEYVGIVFRWTGYDDSNNTDLNRIGIDNVTISAIPEPATLALLFAGAGLLLLRRRR